MKNFFRVSTRLNCDLYASFRYFVVKDQLNKWTNAEEVELKQNGVYLISPFQDDIHTIGTQVVDYERNKYIKLKWQDNRFIKNELSRQLYVEIYFMPCTSKTEYCTEIQIVVSGWDKIDGTVDIQDAYQTYFDQWIEGLRKKVNGKWMIEDKDLSSGYLVKGKI